MESDEKSIHKPYSPCGGGVVSPPRNMQTNTARKKLGRGKLKEGDPSSTRHRDTPDSAAQLCIDAEERFVMKKVCKTEGCERESRARGLCRKHYQHDRSVGRVPVDDPTAKGCDYDGCDRCFYARGYCRAHFVRLLRNGYVTPDRDPARNYMCIIEGCDHPQESRGFCETHARRDRRHRQKAREQILQ